jgi:hypothetical protein
VFLLVFGRAIQALMGFWEGGPEVCRRELGLVQGQGQGLKGCHNHLVGDLVQVLLGATRVPLRGRHNHLAGDLVQVLLGATRVLQVLQEGALRRDRHTCRVWEVCLLCMVRSRHRRPAPGHPRTPRPGPEDTTS